MPVKKYNITKLAAKPKSIPAFFVLYSCFFCFNLQGRLLSSAGVSAKQLSHVCEP